MNKRLLIGLAGAGIVGGATFGFAATLDLTTDNLGANSADVLECDPTGVDVDYTVEWDVNKYQVNIVTVSGIDGACAGDDIAVTLAGATDNSLGEETNSTVTAGAMTFDFSTDDVSAQAVENVHVAISGGDPLP